MHMFKGIMKMFQEPKLLDISTTVYLPLEGQYGQGNVVQTVDFPTHSKLGYTINSIMFTGPGSELGHKVMINRRHFMDVTRSAHSADVVLPTKPHSPELTATEKAEAISQHISRVTYLSDVDTSLSSKVVTLQAFDHTSHLDVLDYLEVSCHVVDGHSGFEELFLESRDAIVKVDNVRCYLSGVTHTRIQTDSSVYFHISAPEVNPIRGMSVSKAYLSIGDTLSARQNNLFVSVDLRGSLHALEAAELFKAITGLTE